MKEKRQVSLLSLWNRKKLPNRVIDPKESTTTTTTTTIASDCKMDGSSSHCTRHKNTNTDDTVGTVTNTSTADEEVEVEEQENKLHHMTMAISSCHHRRHPPQVMYNDCTTSHSNNNDYNQDNYYQPSDYELLRLKNIARNEARLRELGLLTSNKPSTTAVLSSSHKNTTMNQKQKRRKLSLPRPTIDTLSNCSSTLRRSARLSVMTTTTNTNKNTISSSHQQSASSSSPSLPIHTQEDKDQYMPLFHNKDVERQKASIASLSRQSSSNGTNPITSEPILWSGNFPTVQPVTTRLIPPSGLNAIYTLQFSSYPYYNCTNDSLMSSTSSFVVGAGKSGIIALWDMQRHPNSTTKHLLVPGNTTTPDKHDIPNELDPIVSWKAHSGRWISSAFFIPSIIDPSTNNSNSTNTAATPSAYTPTQQQLMTAGNDGYICLWDISSVNCTTGIPKLQYQSDKELHTSGIFSMDVALSGNDNQHPEMPSSSSLSLSFVSVCTGSKDKSVALSEITPTQILRTTWRSNYHTSKVGAVRIQPNSKKVILIASASDDGTVAIHDVRSTTIASTIPNAHSRPHSVEWIPSHEQQFITAGLDDTIHLFDLRNVSNPMVSFRGHVSSSQRIKSIHRPIPCKFATCNNSGSFDDTCILTGGEGTNSLFIYQCNSHSTTKEPLVMETQLQHKLRQGMLPQGCGDVGSIAIQNNRMCLSTSASGDILLLDQPPSL